MMANITEMNDVVVIVVAIDMAMEMDVVATRVVKAT